MFRLTIFMLAAPLLQAQFAIQPGQSGNQSFHLKNGTLDAEGQTLEQLLEMAYHLQAGAIVGPSWIREKTFDVHGALPSREQWRPLLQQSLAAHFKLAVSKETRSMDVYILGASPDAAQKLAGSGAPDNDNMSHIRGKNLSADSIGRYLSSWLEKPVIDETGLAGRYTVDITWDANDSNNLLQAVERAGLRLRKDQRPIEVLVIKED